MNSHAQVLNKGLKKVPTLVKTTSTILKTKPEKCETLSFNSIVDKWYLL